MMSAETFRDRYPTARLTSDIVPVPGDQYVVRVTLEVPDAGLSTGLAADPCLEVAEDRARQRALQGWYLPKSVAAPAVIEASSEAGQSSSADAAASVHFDGELDTPPNRPQVNGAQISPVATPGPTTAIAPPDWVVSDPAPAVTEAPLTETRSATQAASSTAAAPPSAPEPIAAEQLPPPVNLADVIAQTDVELRRLQWSVADGRDYLEQTYGKRSRHELTDEELIEFLCYLESQPDPSIA